MAKHRQTIHQLLWFDRSIAVILSYDGKLRYSCVPHSGIYYNGGTKTAACLQREPLEMVLRHDGGDGVDFGDTRQIPHSYHGVDDF